MRSALTKLSGVVSAEVSIPNGATVKVQKGKVTADQLIAAVEKAGPYKAKVKADKEEKKKKS